MRADQAAIDGALGDIRSGLQADGYDLEVIEASESALKVRVVALEDACEDCLSPPNIMAMIISGSVDAAYAPDEVQLEYPAKD